jgi:OHCU decarboxylase
MRDKQEFLKKYGGIYEHSPWIAEAAFAAGADTAEKIHAAMKAAVTNASREKKLALICAHPDLACAERNLTAESTSEQQGAGLKQCSPEEFAEFQKLNIEYKKKFGFPFIIAVKGLNRQDILQAFRSRIHNDAAAEFDTALEQIHKIARFRLMALS